MVLFSWYSPVGLLIITLRSFPFIGFHWGMCPCPTQTPTVKGSAKIAKTRRTTWHAEQVKIQTSPTGPAKGKKKIALQSPF
jgi:hypothetical protein